jgi:cell division protein FtsL
VTRLNTVLLLVLLTSSLWLVRVAHDARSLFAALDRAQAEERLLDTEHERLKAEKQAQATPLRVEKTARDKLGMRSATPAVTQYVVWSRAASAAEGRAP